MTLTQQSLVRTVRRKARLARQNVQEAEEHLAAANQALAQALPRHDEHAIADAAVRTLRAENEVREAAHELDGVNELLAEGGAAVPGSASGEGAASVLPYLRRKPAGKPDA